MSLQNRFILFFGLFFLIEFYVYQGFKNLVSSSWARWVYWGFTILIYGIILYFMLNFNRAERNPKYVHWIISLFTIFLIPKLLAFFFLLIDDIVRLGQLAISQLSTQTAYIPERRKFLSLIALGSTALLSGLFIDGVLFGKYRHRARKIKLKFKNLPKNFQGYKIVQISDVHSGSFEDPSKLQHAIDLINQQNADLVLFTGDMINNYADEFKPFIPLFSKIKARDGKFSVLGNHDYGTYGIWKNQKEKDLNIPLLIQYQKEAGFEILNNEHRVIDKNGEKIYLLGVENWGEKPFPQIGDLDKALRGVPYDTVKILMSHDPTHFDRKVKHHPTHVHLTLSGHTHGMQFGLDLKNIKWSPVQYRYPKWADLYESEGKYLYVNRGFGVIGFPGRVGILPEITVIELDGF